MLIATAVLMRVIATVHKHMMIDFVMKPLIRLQSVFLQYSRCYLQSQYVMNIANHFNDELVRSVYLGVWS